MLLREQLLLAQVQPKLYVRRSLASFDARYR
jgi:hypothetical protein